MTEELEKEATAYALEWGDKTDGTYACCRDGYLAGAEPREKRIAELEAQIEKMKCCGNCNGILDGGRRAEKCRHCMDSKKLSEWELANE